MIFLKGFLIVLVCFFIFLEVFLVFLEGFFPTFLEGVLACLEVFDFS